MILIYILKNRTDTGSIQVLLGVKDIKTVLIYNCITDISL
jgi:site-specific recombinase XerD